MQKNKKIKKANIRDGRRIRQILTLFKIKKLKVLSWSIRVIV